MTSQLVERGIEAFRSEDYEEAILYLIQGLDYHPDDWAIWFLLGMSHCLAGDQKESHRIFEHVIELCPDSQLRQKAEAALVDGADAVDLADCLPPVVGQLAWPV